MALKRPTITQQDMQNLLMTCYQKAVCGIPRVSPPIEVVTREYKEKYKGDVKAATNAFIRNQIIKCTTSGFLSGLGGAITLPVTIPANMASVIYMQLRMIAGIADLAGLDENSDQVRTLTYACLAGLSLGEVAKKIGVAAGKKITMNMINKIPSKVLAAINRKVGFKMVAKFGEEGVVSLGKLLPIIGGAIGGGFDAMETKIIAKRAVQMFFDGDFSMENQEEDIIDLDFQEIPDEPEEGEEEPMTEGGIIGKVTYGK